MQSPPIIHTKGLWHYSVLPLTSETLQCDNTNALCIIYCIRQWFPSLWTERYFVTNLMLLILLQAVQWVTSSGFSLTKVSKKDVTLSTNWLHLHLKITGKEMPTACIVVNHKLHAAIDKFARYKEMTINCVLGSILEKIKLSCEGK